MIRRKHSVAFSSGFADEPEPSPMETVSNISDVMLVLAVALMVALIARIGVDFSAFQLDESQLEAISDQEFTDGMSSDDSGDGSDYYEVGKVYRNSEGDMFMLGN